MADNKKPPYIEHSVSHSAKIYPFDYSTGEVIADCKKNTRFNKVTKKTIRSHLIDRDWFVSHWHSLLFYDTRPDKIKSNLAGSKNEIEYSVPIEAYELLRQFTQCSVEDALPNQMDDETVQDSVIKNTFVRLNNSMQHDSEFNPFLSHTMYANKDFSHSMMQHFWKHEVETRLSHLMVLAKKRTPSDQIQVLQECLTTLDWGISVLQGKPESEDDSLDTLTTMTCLLPLLHSLTESRKRKPQEDNQYISYLIKNLAIPNDEPNTAQKIYLSDVFSQLTQRTAVSKKLLNRFRDAYLKNLASECTYSDFEYHCKNLTAYLETFAPNQTEDSIRETVIGLYRTYFKRIIDSVHFNPNAKDTSSQFSSHLEKLLHSQIRSEANALSIKYDETIRIITHFNSMEAYLSINGYETHDDFINRVQKEVCLLSDIKSLPKDEGNAILNKYKYSIMKGKEDFVLGFKLFFSMWEYAFDDNTLLPIAKVSIDTDRLFSEIITSLEAQSTRIAEQLAVNYKKAEVFFNLPSRNMDTLGFIDSYRSILLIFYNHLTSKDGLPYHVLVKNLTPLLNDMLCVVLLRSAEEGIERTTSTFINLQNLYNTKIDDPPKEMSST